MSGSGNGITLEVRAQVTEREVMPFKVRDHNPQAPGTTQSVADTAHQSGLLGQRFFSGSKTAARKSQHLQTSPDFIDSEPFIQAMYVQYIFDT